MVVIVKVSNRKSLIIYSFCVVISWTINHIINHYIPGVTSITNIGYEVIRRNIFAAIYSVFFLCWILTLVVTEILTLLYIMIILNNVLKRINVDCLIENRSYFNEALKQDIIQIEIIFYLCYLVIFPIVIISNI